MSKYSIHSVQLFGERYIFAQDSDGNGPIATKEQYENFHCSHAYLEHGIIWQHHKAIGTVANLTFLGPAEIF